MIRALLSIRPQFADAIARGDKKWEFRRCVFARQVDVVVVYVTAPVARVVGEFDVRGVVAEPVQALWDLTRSAAGVAEEIFFSYFQGKELGFAIEIGEYRPYPTPFHPADVLGRRPPQSFVYLDDPGDSTLAGRAWERAAHAAERQLARDVRVGAYLEARAP